VTFHKGGGTSKGTRGAGRNGVERDSHTHEGGGKEGRAASLPSLSENRGEETLDVKLLEKKTTRKPIQTITSEGNYRFQTGYLFPLQKKRIENGD